MESSDHIESVGTHEWKAPQELFISQKKSFTTVKTEGLWNVSSSMWFMAKAFHNKKQGMDKAVPT